MSAATTHADPFGVMRALLGGRPPRTVAERNRTWAEEGGYWPEIETEPMPGDDEWLQERVDNWTEREL